MNPQFANVNVRAAEDTITFTQFIYLHPMLYYTIILHTLKCRNVTPRVNSYMCLHTAVFNSLQEFILHHPSFSSRQGHFSRRPRGRADYSTVLDHLKTWIVCPNSNSGRVIYISLFLSGYPAKVGRPWEWTNLPGILRNLKKWWYLNLLKPTGHVMHQQLNIQQFYVLPTLHFCVLYLSENKQRLVPLTA